MPMLRDYSSDDDSVVDLCGEESELELAPAAARPAKRAPSKRRAKESRAVQQMQAKAAAQAAVDAARAEAERERALRMEAERRAARPPEVAACAAAGDEASAARAQLVGELGQEVAAMLKGVPPAEMRAEITGIAQLFELTKGLVKDSTSWKPALVLPALQFCLSAGANAMGQTMETLLDQNSHVADVRAQLGLAVACRACSSGGQRPRQPGAEARGGDDRQPQCT